MLMEIVVHFLPKRIEQELDAFPSRNLRSWHKITVSCDKYYGINLLFQSESRNVNTYTHVHSFLTESKLQIIGSKAFPCRCNRL